MHAGYGDQGEAGRDARRHAARAVRAGDDLRSRSVQLRARTGTRAALRANAGRPRIIRVAAPIGVRDVAWAEGAARCPGTTANACDRPGYPPDQVPGYTCCYTCNPTSNAAA